jgi:hypothetical protein
VAGEEVKRSQGFDFDALFSRKVWEREGERKWRRKRTRERGGGKRRLRKTEVVALCVQHNLTTQIG